MSTYPTRNRIFKKNRKKIQKIKKHHCGFFSSHNMLGLAEKDRKEKTKKKIVPMSSNPTCNREFQKNSKKFKKHYYGFFSSQNRLGMAEKERK